MHSLKLLEKRTSFCRPNRWAVDISLLRSRHAKIIEISLTKTNSLKYGNFYRFQIWNRHVSIEVCCHNDSGWKKKTEILLECFSIFTAVLKIVLQMRRHFPGRFELFYNSSIYTTYIKLYMNLYMIELKQHLKAFNCHRFFTNTLKTR